MALSIEDRIKAEEQVEAFITVLTKRYGIQEEEIPDLIEIIRWSADHRRGINRVGWSALLGIVGIAASGIMLAVWEGIKHILTRGP